MAQKGEGPAFLLSARQKVSDECAIWPFGRDSEGYAATWHNGASIRAHAVNCEAVHGPKPVDKDHAAHNCGNRLCVNPRHLRWATHAENMQDKVLHGTNWRHHGEAHANAKLTDAQADEIRSMKGAATQQAIADIYGVSRSLVSLIHRGKQRTK